MPDRRRTLILVALAAVLCACAGVAFLATRQSGDSGSANPGADASYSPRKPGRVEVTRVPTEGLPAAVAVGAGRVWAADPLGGTLERITPATLLPVSVEVDGFPTDVAAGGRRAWIPLPDLSSVQGIGRAGSAARPSKLDGLPFQLAVDRGEGTLWAMSQRSLQPLDADSDRPLSGPVALDRPASAITAGGGRAWVVLGGGEIAAFEVGEAEPVARVAQEGVFTLSLGEGRLWTLDRSGHATALDPEGGEETGAAGRVDGALAIGAGLGYAWVVTDAGQVVRLDPQTGRRVGDAIDAGRPINAGEPGYAPLPADVALGAGAAWVAGPGGRSLLRITPGGD